jgi:hypothetical protein
MTPTYAACRRLPGRVWAYAGAVMGGVVSIAANVAHSYVPPAGAPPAWAPQTGAVIGAVFWPVAVFVAVEILARTTWPASRRWVALRYAGLLPVGLVAAVVSYRHLSGLLAFYGEDGLTATLGPLAVDGLMVMATGALIATGTAAADTRPDTEADTAPEAQADIEPDTGQDTAPTGGRTPKRTRRRTPGRTFRPDTATAVARLRQRHPDMSSADIAKRLGVTDRTVRRHLSAHANTTGQPQPDPLNHTQPHDRNGPHDPSTLAA